MKLQRIAICIALLLSCLAASAHEDLFAKYKKTENVTSVYISGKAFQLCSGLMEIDDLGIEQIKEQVSGLNMLNTENKTLCAQLSKEFKANLSVRHDLLMEVDEEDEQITFYVIIEQNIVSELLMLSVSPDEFVALRLTGRFAMEDIQSIVEMTK